MTFREEIRRQAESARREMVRNGELLTRSEFRARLRVSERRLGQMLATGSVFSMVVDGAAYFPAVLAEATVDRQRLQAVCRILVPAPSACRLDYLISPQGNLGDIVPLKALADDASYRRLREMARAWAAEWSRTTLKIYAGFNEPGGSEPTYVAVCEADPRTNLWKRALQAMDAGGYITPPGPYPRRDTATVLIFRSEAGKPDDVLEARLDVDIVDDMAHMRIHAGDVSQELDAISVVGDDTIVDVVHRIVLSLCDMQRR
ncbi:hypothetical protein [Paraburkholderia atlantica]|uniref:hypothetical protein n=1 Tax=Paraburkholderia atlantica TaxID=2654982 RepID=UPI001613D435|nr:hypothetical protein [Paraburkholderia atlantica]MBB5417064.1 hypothetical protein [Paraburkholderia atlantica]